MLIFFDESISKAETVLLLGSGFVDLIKIRGYQKGFK